MPVVYPASVDELLPALLAGIQTALGPGLLGAYLYGSIATGDFDVDVSDLDLLVVAETAVNDDAFQRLAGVHNAIVAGWPEWDDRLDIDYVSKEALATFRDHPSQIAVITPGEPFGHKLAGADWLLNWYMVQERGITLIGPPPVTFIGRISRDEFVENVHSYAAEWKTRVLRVGSQKEEAYVVLTMCRALYAQRKGEQSSKRSAAAWASEAVPEYAPLIAWAVAARDNWRSSEATPASPETIRFVEFVVAKLE
jgi:predicted nucleotidyltransferase